MFMPRRNRNRIGFLTAVMSSLLLPACSTVVIRDSQDPSGTNKVPANISPLRTYLDESETNAFLVLVHGVGFHCPTYGLDPDNGWLDRKTLKHLGLEAVKPDEPLKPQFIPDTENRRGDIVDSGSGLYLLQRRFSYHRTDGKLTTVDVAEITWSGLTAWLKLKELGVDYSQAVPAGDGRRLGPGVDTYVACPGFTDITYPFTRQVLNRIVKETTLDGALSDAVIYVGTYGPKIEMGVAEILCRLVSSKTYDGVERCQWRDADQEKLESEFLFMTHSLGSRIIFDTLLELDGHATRAGVNLFDNARKESMPVVEHIIRNTRAVYMFANQLPILQLADVPLSRLSAGAPAELDSRTGPTAGNEISDATSRTAPHLSWFAAVRSQLKQDETKPKSTLEVVAFSDPNDLLSYTIPPWFARESGDFQIQITNVKLSNAIHWFHLYESATDAHDRYMANPRVWKVISCGATKGKTGTPCPPAAH